jgi:putative flippase GtrA
MTLAQIVPRFVLIGLICAVLHNVIMLSLDRLGLHYALSGAVSFALVVVTGYALHAKVTFGEMRSLRSFLRYAAAMAMNYPATVALLFLMSDLGGLPILVTVPTATVIMLVWNFLASRWSISQSKSVPTRAA